MNLEEKLRYLATSAGHAVARRHMACPSCGETGGAIVSRKYLVTVLKRCNQCRLLYRAPTTSAEAYQEYYQTQYSSGMTTELPTEEELELWFAESFANTPKSFERYVDILKALNISPGSKLLDYGCSWGYGTWQFERQGYDVTGYDVSTRRVEFGRERLGLNLVADREQIQGRFDALFSTHVVEHVPAVASLFSFVFSKLKPDGIFVAVTPNGSMAYRRRRPKKWQRVWGFKHPILLDDEYLRQAFDRFPYLITSRLSDLKSLDGWSRGRATVIGDTGGWELLVTVRNSPQGTAA